METLIIDYEIREIKFKSTSRKGEQICSSWNSYETKWSGSVQATNTKLIYTLLPKYSSQLLHEIFKEFLGRADETYI